MSAEAEAFCVVFSSFNPFVNEPTNANAFVYAEPEARKRTVSIGGVPKATLVADGHVFFQLETKDAEHRTGITILAYNIATDKKHVIAFPDASRWQYEAYDRIHVPRGQTNVLHFYYHKSGNRLKEVKDYREGIYSFEIPTGEIRWFAELTQDIDDPHYTPRALDGRFVFFEGQSPFGGFRFVSSPWDFFRTQLRRETKEIKVLHSFSKSSASKGGTYVMSGLSPCGRYALVRFMELRRGESEWLNIYYLIDVLSGNTRVLLRDEVQRKTPGSMSPVWWVRAPD